MQSQPPQSAEEVETQIDSVTDLYRHITSCCASKCAEPPKEGYLKIREAVCLDRCVSKFFATNEAIGKVLQRYQENAQRQQEATEQLAGTSLTGMLGL
ncbi:hypothetical protein P389DRAFT_166964 [Cystobasidium minutum MCA 4210]|uniref:uncharacterized protein n=1 Tax=Cystobasidium minutum MCA 4210 TaxID=1397322 RepID=UPI0034CD9936|eukprot:jgi/Rhomi1/166964/fgenesh1_kg.2_\